IIGSLIKYNKFEKNLNFNQFYQKNNEKYIQKKFSKEKQEELCLQIGDIATIENSFIYQDLSISLLLYYKKIDKESFYYSGFQNLSEYELKKRHQIQIERYEHAKYIFTMSKYLRDFLINHEGMSKDKVIHVGGGINLPSNDDKSLNIKNRRRILFVGRDFKRKGGDLVVESYKLLRKTKFYNLELYIAGPTKIDKRFLGEGIYFLGDISSEKLSYYFNLCDIFCMPSKFEAYGLAFIEALSYGLPCIGVNKFEMPYFIKEGYNGFLLENMNSEIELAEKIETLLISDEIFENTKKHKSLYKEEFSWDAVATRIISKINRES
ncbi:glycosyltransferase family 4 protein, partial [Enterococcus faecium]|nr:glycosyltransferase family 4 protein [Enterococcus faecium]